MRCRTCGVNLMPGAKTCPNCGTVVPRPDETVVDTSAQEPFIPPTVYGGPIPSTPNYNPNIQNPYDRPAQPSSPSYNNQPNQYPSSPYNQTEPNQYQPGSFNPNQAAPNQYQPGSFNQNQAAPNQYPNQYIPGGIPPAYPPPGYMPPQQQPRRKTRWGLIIGIIAGVLVLACIGSSVLVFASLGKSTANTQATPRANTATTPEANTTPAGTNATPASTNTTPAANTNTTPAANSNSTGAIPSGLTIDPNAASIITDAQSAKNINQDTAAPVDPTSTFKAGDRVYVVFKINNNKVDVTTQKIYVGAKFYVDSVLAAKINPITFDIVVPGGYFAGTYKVASQGTAELYLCYKSDCSDGKLAQVVNFTVA